MAKTVVNTDSLRAAGSAISEIAQLFRSEYRALLDAAMSTRRGWQGSDNDMFITRVVGLEDDFAHLFQLLYGCGTDLKQAADVYDEMLASSKEAASLLPSDIDGASYPNNGSAIFGFLETRILPTFTVLYAGPFGTEGFHPTLSLSDIAK